MPVNATPSHIIEEYVDLRMDAHVNPLKQKSTAIIDLFRGQSAKFIAKNILILRKRIRYLLSFDGEDPNQSNEWGHTPLKFAILFMSPEDVAYLLWRKADPRFRPKGGLYETFDNAIELTITSDKPEHFKMITYSNPKRNLPPPIPRLQVKSCKVSEVGNQIHSDLVFTNNRSVKTRYMTTAEFHKQESEAVQTAVFKLFTLYFSDPGGDMRKTKQNFDKEFSAEANLNIDIIFDNEKKAIIGFVLIRGDDDNGTAAERFEYMALEADSFLRCCGGVGMFAIRWACVTKNMYRSSIVKTYHLTTDYNSYGPMQDELITPKHLSKSMLEFNQRMVDKEFRRKVQIYYGRFIAVKELLKVTDKKDPNRKKGFDEFCYDLFILSYDNPADKKKAAEEAGGEPVQAAVVSSVVGSGFLKRRAQIFKAFLDFDLCAHVDELTPAMRRKANIFMPAFAKYQQTVAASPLKPEDFGDERVAFWLGVQNMAKL